VLPAWRGVGKREVSSGAYLRNVAQTEVVMGVNLLYRRDQPSHRHVIPHHS